MAEPEADPQPRIEEARRRFARSLVGAWTTVSPLTLSTVIGQQWEIRADGTGRFSDTGPFDQPRRETRFEWRQTQAFLFEIRLTECIPQRPEYAVELTDADREWRVIQYDFVAVPVWFGVQIGLIDASQTGQEWCGFLDGMAPLTYAGE